ncbi:MAG: hypothetical protein L3J54_00065 [Draconibacterium sp.]|nr:hypothetical protein [Draconibacterium sp.]
MNKIRDKIELAVGRKSQFAVSVFRELAVGRKFSVAVDSFQFSALNGRKATAQGNALCKECNVNFFAPRWAANYGDLFAWGKTKGIEQIWARFRVETGMTINNEIPETRTTKNRSLSSQYKKNGSLCATRLAVQNRLAHLISAQKSEGFAWSETLAGANNIYLN